MVFDAALNSTSTRIHADLADRPHSLLAFLDDATIPPTNNTAEHEIRGAVVLRKIGGCHRQEAHALAHSVLASHAQTAHRRGQRLDHLVANWMTPHATSDPKRPARTPSRLKR
jgi:transposase